MNNRAPVLYAIVTGARVAESVGKLVDLAQADGWDVCVIASPNGRRFVDADALAVKTGHPVRSEYKHPDAPDVLPPAQGIIVAPITSNSLAKWAAGISDTLPLGLLVEAVGLGLPSGGPFHQSSLDQFSTSAGRDSQALAVGCDHADRRHASRTQERRRLRRSVPVVGSVASPARPSALRSSLICSAGPSTRRFHRGEASQVRTALSCPWTPVLRVTAHALVGGLSECAVPA